MRLRTAGFAVLLFVLTLVSGAAFGQERFGGIAGVVTDTSQAPVPGATVTITNKQTGAKRTTVTSADGGYRVPDLEPGRYSVTIELDGFQKATADDVLVLLGRTFTVGTQLKVGSVSEEVSVTGEAVKAIDLTTVTLQHNVTAEEFNALPKSRTFQSMAMTAPGVTGLVDLNNSVNNGIEGGLQINGASAAENSFTVDGVVTNSPIEGQARQNTVFDYLQEVQVKTSGIAAEYGGALGGVISAVTKSGGNRFAGEAHYFYSGSALSSAPVNRLVLDPVTLATQSYVQDDKQHDARNEFGGSLGGPIVKDRLFFFGSVSPRLINRTNNYLFSNGTTPGSIDQSSKLWQGFGKVTFSSSRVQANASILTTPQRSTGTLPSYNGVGADVITSSQAGNAANIPRGFAVDQNTISGNMDVWLGRNNYVSLRGGYFYDNYKDTGVSQTTSYTYMGSQSSVGLAGVPASLQGPVGTQNTPRVEITQFDTTKQPYLQMDYNHSFTALGQHLLKGGAGYRHTANDVNNSYPGGYVYIFWNQTYKSTATQATDTGTYGYYQVNNFGTQGKVGANIWSLYAQDAWSLGNRLVLNLGLRTENEKVPTFRPDIAAYAFKFGFGDKLAPRLGVAYDLTGNGRSKLSANWGRYYDWTKYELARGSFGGDVWQRYTRSLDTLDLSSINLSNMPGRDLFGGSLGYQDLRGTYIENTDPNIKPMYEDSTNVGWDYQLNSTMQLGVHYVHNSLGRTIEDMGSLVDGSNIYVIGNPGEGQNTIFPPSYPDVTAPFATPKPKRIYDALEVSLERRLSKGWFAGVNYTLSRLYGNYAGLSNTDEISTPTTNVSAGTSQQQGGNVVRAGSNASSAWDVDEILWDSKGHLDPQGRLATDRPNVVKAYGAYQFRFGTQIGLSEFIGSGTPVSTQVIVNDGYAPFVNGRGDMGRTPTLTRTDLLVAHELKLSGKETVRIELNVINLFNQRTATHIFNFLNRGAPAGGSVIAGDAIDLSGTNLAAGYDYNALILATPDGAKAYDPRYGKADLFQNGTQGQLSVRLSF